METFTATTTKPTLIMERIHLPIYAELLSRSEDVLEHYVEDLTVHDKHLLLVKVKPGQTWLWQVRKTGTWLVRWDEDSEAGTKNSLPELLIHQSIRGGSWGDPQWYLIKCHEVRNGEPYGIVSQQIPVERLAAQLPRPKPKVMLPGEKRLATVGGY